MSNTLPDNPADWPDDPFELLGIDYESDEKTARRSYIRLIRRFKPEHAPQEFQRIREAYESVKKAIEYREHYSDWDDDWEDEDDLESTDEWTATAPLDDDHERADTREVRRLATDVEEQANQAWQLAIDGRVEDAYAKLLSLSDSHRDNNVYIRLYWLLKLHPGLDEKREPCDWLVDGLRANQLMGPLRELYRREIAENHREATSRRFDRLLDCDTSPGVLADLLQWRWNALDDSQRHLVVDDLRRVNNRMVLDDEETWGRLLLIALKQVAFASLLEDNNALEDCQIAIEQLPHLHQMLENELDEMEQVLEIVDAWDSLRYNMSVPENWLDLIVESSTRSAADIQPQVQSLIEDIARDPFQALERFDNLNASCPAAVDLFGGLISECSYRVNVDDHDERTWEDFRRLIRRLFALRTFEYKALRARLLRFCLHEMIDPSLVAMLVGQEEDLTVENWSDEIADDAALRNVYVAHAAFHS